LEGGAPRPGALPASSRGLDTPRRSCPTTLGITALKITALKITALKITALGITALGITAPRVTRA